MASRLSTLALLIMVVLSCLARPAFGRWSARETAWLSGLLGAPGEMSQKELQSEPVQQAAQFAVKQLDLGARPGSAAHVLVRVTSGTSQIVAGVRYKLELEIGRSQWCSLNKERKVTTKDCPVDKGTVKTWSADVWVKPTNPAQYELMDLQQVYQFSD